MIDDLTACESRPHSALRLIIFMLEATLLLICCVLSQHRLASVMSLLVFAVFVACLAFSQPRFVLKYLALMFAVLANIVGVAVIELGDMVYLGEMRCYSGYAGSLPLIVLGRWLFLVVLLAYDSKWGIERRGVEERSISERGAKWLAMATWATLVLGVVVFVHAAPNPSFSLGMDRFEYSEAYTIGIWGSLNSALGYLVVFPALSTAVGNKKAGYFSLAVYLLYLFWTGTKFGGYFTVVCVFLLAHYGQIMHMGIRVLRTTLCAVAVAFACLVGFAGFAYSFTSSTAGADFYQARLAQQGQLWWKTYDLYEGDAQPDKFGQEVEGQLAGDADIASNVGSHYGIYNIMYLTVPSSVVDAKLSGGSRYTEAGYASAYYYFGAAGVCAFSVVMALVVAIVQNAFARALLEKGLVRSLLLSRLYGTGRTALSMFVFAGYFNLASIASYIVLFFSAGILSRPSAERNAGASKASRKLVSDSPQKPDGRGGHGSLGTSG